MEHIIATQNSAAKPATGKDFLVGIAAIILKLAAAQLIINVLISLSGIGLFNLVFYAFAVVLLIRFMKRTVAGNVYTLKTDTLVLQRLMGDSTVLGVEIPHGDILAIRPIVCAEKLSLDYRQVTYVDTRCAPGLRMHAAFVLSLFAAGLARAVAGKAARQENGYVVVYMDSGKRSACAFRPDEAFVKVLERTLSPVFGVDEREMLETYGAKSLRRAFGDLYPHVPDAVTPQELAFEREEFARRREARLEKAAKRRNIPLDQYKSQLAAKKRRRVRRVKRIKAMFPVKSKKARRGTEE